MFPLLIRLFDKIPEGLFKNRLRHFIVTSRLVPEKVSDFCPIKGYLLHFQPKHGDVVIDAGAFPGDFALLAARRVGPGGKVICFEPEPENCRNLQRIVSASGLTNIEVFPLGLDSRKRQTTVRKSTLTGKGDAEVTMEMIPLDLFLAEQKIPSIQFLKMDIEGYELEAVKGGEQALLANNVQVAIASYHIVDGEPTSQRLEALLTRLGYKAWTDFPPHLTTYAKKAS